MDVAILGYGVVGSGVAKVLQTNHTDIVLRSMQPDVRLKYILDLREFPGDPFADLIIHDVHTILSDPAVGVVVECMGGLHPAYEFVTRALAAGKSVVTSNKELVANKGYEILKLAEEKGVNFLFEASVGGGIPIIRPMYQCLAANEIDEVVGILNGTTNFILTRMIEDAMPFDQALRMAQENGYAEHDPSADINGPDTCRKICILAALAFGKHVYPDQVPTTGISNISQADVAYAEALGGSLKLIARATRRENGKISCVVAPMLVTASSILANVRDVYNAILVRGNALGDAVFYGRGAGQLPTASAVVADIIDCCKHVAHRKFFGWEDGSVGYILPEEEDVCRWFIRCKNLPGAAEAYLHQHLRNTRKTPLPGGITDETALLTEELRLADVQAALSAANVEPITLLRYLDFS
jgi:homoserine dehydrogenase